MKKTVGCLVGSLLLGVGGPAMATPLLPVTYTAPPGEVGAYFYIDDTGNQLLDGEIGGDNWRDDLGQGHSYEWLGWLEIEPVLTFDFGAAVALDSIGFHFNNWHEGAVGLPTGITFSFSDDGISFGSDVIVSIPYDPNRAARWMDFALAGATGRYVRASMTDVGGHGSWIFVSEARFDGVAVPDPPRPDVPEPVSLLLVGSGLIALGVRRRLV